MQLPFLIIVVLTAGGNNAAAIIDTCKRTSSDADRIACLEAAILMRDAAPGTASVAEPNAEPAAASAPPASEESPVDAPATEKASKTAAPEAMMEKPPQPASPVPARAAAERTPDEPRQGEPRGIGAEQVEARADAASGQQKQLEEARGLRVESYRKLPYDKIQVNLENGQIWRQLRSDRQRIRVDLERNQTVDIEQSSIGGYRLRLNEMRRILRVERIR